MLHKDLFLQVEQISEIFQQKDVNPHYSLEFHLTLDVRFLNIEWSERFDKMTSYKSRFDYYELLLVGVYIKTYCSVATLRSASTIATVTRHVFQRT